MNPLPNHEKSSKPFFAKVACGLLSRRLAAGSSAVSDCPKTDCVPACEVWNWDILSLKNSGAYGLMTGAAKRVIAYRFEYVGLDVMMIRTGEENIASQRIIEKCGFQYEGTLRRIYKIYDGTIKPVRCYTMLREEYDGLRHAGML